MWTAEGMAIWTVDGRKVLAVTEYRLSLGSRYVKVVFVDGATAVIHMEDLLLA